MPTDRPDKRSRMWQERITPCSCQQDHERRRSKPNYRFGHGPLTNAYARRFRAGPNELSYRVKQSMDVELRLEHIQGKTRRPVPPLCLLGCNLHRKLVSRSCRTSRAWRATGMRRLRLHDGAAGFAARHVFRLASGDLLTCVAHGAELSDEFDALVGILD